MKYTSSNDEFSSTLITAKTRLAPLKKLTLPRLELMGALLGARLTNTLLKAFNLPPSNTRFWTDSKIALQWIRGSASEWKPFISNRVREIQALTDPQHWGHCDGKTNPADIPTRGRSVTTLLSESLWWNGPAWLTDKEAPESKSTTQSEEALSKEAQEELRSCFRNQPQASLQVIEPADEKLMDINRFSSLSKLLRITAWIHRYCHNSRNPNDKSTGELAALEISKAESFWVRHEQLDSFPTEMEHLHEKKGIAKSSKLLTLNPILDEDAIACVGGRLRNKEFSYEERHPRILPSSNHLTDLIARHHHNQVMHGGVNETLVDVRERYWIIKGRQVIKRVIHRCTICRRFRAKPSDAITAPLPPSRTTPALPFEVTGLDFAGPLYSKDNSKLYIALFTCAVTRAIHLELVSDMSTYNFMLAFRRFVSRRGRIKIIYSDNAKTYKRADLDLKRLLSTIKNAEIAQHFGNLQISWRFITDRAPWQGGFYERLVRSVKNALRKTLGQARLSYEELETTLIEAEAAINSRPLTYVYPDAGEPSPLTPAHFLVGKRLTALPSGKFDKNDSHAAGKADLTKRWKYHQQLNEKFWNRWKTDYLLELRLAHHSIKKTPTRPLQVDDIVLIGEPRMPRLTWKTAVIEETFIGRDGQVRSCMVRLPNGTKMRRPIQLLYFLET